MAAINLVRANGYAATSVDALCERAGVTKGGFFHHFKSKEDLAVAAAAHWSKITKALFDAAPFNEQSDPLERLLGYIRFRKEILQGDLAEFTCFAGTMVQETYGASEKIQSACMESIFGHAKTLERDVAQAKALYAADATWSARSLTLYTQATLQGAFILAKASGDVQDAIDCVEHLENYVRLLFVKG